jgi:hypothetical protein
LFGDWEYEGFEGTIDLFGEGATLKISMCFIVIERLSSLGGIECYYDFHLKLLRYFDNSLKELITLM